MSTHQTLPVIPENRLAARISELQDAVVRNRVLTSEGIAVSETPSGTHVRAVPGGENETEPGDWIPRLG